MSGETVSLYGLPEGTSVYSAPWHPDQTPPPFQPFGPPIYPPFSFPQQGLSDADRALLKRIEEKLDELLNRTAPEADVIAEIRKRVDAVIAGFGKKP
jgi:hypothetical protein